MESLDYSEDKSDSDKSSSVDPQNLDKRLEALRSTVNHSVEMSLKRILTSKTSVYLLRDIVQAQSDSRPYTIYFIGVTLNVRNQFMEDDDNPRTIQPTSKSEGCTGLSKCWRDYIWEIPIKDFLAASDEVQ
ncbi:8384_t:CDS:2 [Rhizophagus irregularis]|nr:8384_t:CDS:2 [Rhizophagus irregularis]